MHARTLLLVLTAAFLIPVTRGAESDASGSNPALTMWYDQPARHFSQSLPLGNGRLGAMVFGDPSHERIVLNEISLWSGSPQDADRPNAHESLAEIRRLLIEGKNAEAQKLVLANFTCRGPGSGQGAGANVQYGCYQVLGNLHLEFSKSPGASSDSVATDYRRELDLSQAIARLTYRENGVRVEREMFVSAPDQVLALRLSADHPNTLTLELSMDRPERFKTTLSS